MTGTLPLVVEGVSVDYGGLRALDDASLHVERSETVGLIGPNGAGKTTLFDAILGLVQPASGRILVFGEDVEGWPVHRRARLGIARTFQRLELFGSLTVLENLIVALEGTSNAGGLASELLRRPASIDVRRRAHDRADELLETLRLTDHAEARAADLPMGLSRVVELGRALATDPKLLLLDEPSSGLNEEESRELADTLRGVRGRHELSMLVVEHDMGFVLGLSDRVYVLDFGKLIAQGTPDEVRVDPTVRAAYLGQAVAG